MEFYTELVHWFNVFEFSSGSHNISLKLSQNQDGTHQVTDELYASQNVCTLHEKSHLCVTPLTIRERLVFSTYPALFSIAWKGVKSLLIAITLPVVW